MKILDHALELQNKLLLNSLFVVADKYAWVWHAQVSIVEPGGAQTLAVSQVLCNDGISDRDQKP